MTELVAQPDVEAALLRPLTTNEATYMGALIAQAEALLRTAAPSVDARISRYEANPADPSALDPETVKAVLAGVIKRYLANPLGLTSTTDATGPFSHSESYALRGDKDTRGALQITTEDLATLFPQRKRLRAGTIRTRPTLAPRPVGRYGPIPSVSEAIDAVVTYRDEVTDGVPLLPVFEPDSPLL